MSNYEEFIHKMEIMKCQKEIMEQINKLMLKANRNFIAIAHDVNPPRLVHGASSEVLENIISQARYKHNQRILKRAKHEEEKKHEQNP